jgi:hypothetical protein
MKFDEVPEVSRKDGKTLICPDCYTRQSLDGFGLKEKDKDRIIEIIHRGTQHEKDRAK